MICLFSSIKLIMSRNWRFHGDYTVSRYHSVVPVATNLSCHHRWCHSPYPHHVCPGHPSSPDLYRPGSWSGHGHVDHSLDRDGRLFSENNLHGHLGEVGSGNGLHDEGTAPADHLDHGHVPSRIARMRKGEYGPTACWLAPDLHRRYGGRASIFSISSLPIRLLCIS